MEAVEQDTALALIAGKRRLHDVIEHHPVGIPRRIRERGFHLRLVGCLARRAGGILLHFVPETGGEAALDD